MIAFDTCVLVRFLVADDLAQADAAEALMRAGMVPPWSWAGGCGSITNPGPGGVPFWVPFQTAPGESAASEGGRLVFPSGWSARRLASALYADWIFLAIDLYKYVADVALFLGCREGMWGAFAGAAARINSSAKGGKTTLVSSFPSSAWSEMRRGGECRAGAPLRRVGGLRRDFETQWGAVIRAGCA